MDTESTPQPPSRDDALIHAQEALLAARSAVESMADGSDRIYVLDQLASRWLDVADRLEPSAPVKGLHTPSRGQSPSGPYLRVGPAVSGPQTGAQGRTGKGEPRTLNFGPDMPVVHLWQGVAYPEGAMWDVPGDSDGSTSSPSTWFVNGVDHAGQPIFVSHPGQHTASLIVLTAMGGTPTRVLEDTTVFKRGGVQYPLGTVWTDKDGDRWRVGGPDERGELRMVDESSMDLEHQPDYGPDGDQFFTPLAELLQRYGPLVKAEDDWLYTR